ncbi:MAG: malonyl-CoA synthase, partial [Proteobacteria bacterium]|nr:malonyl-CoA synthase [Pseudomonadota bacterium]
LAGVRESAVIGVAHADFGDAVVAVVVPEQGSQLNESDIISLARQQLADFKVPKRVVFIDELPRNSMSKVQKKVLRDTYKGLFS